jgi:hypothetical protein
MLSTRDIIALNNGELDTLDAFKDLQSMINSGEVWLRDERSSAVVMELIEIGRNMLGHTARRDYNGHFVPPRRMMLPGSKGSYQLVANNFGKEYADEIADVE